ncbi:cytochrome P450 [Modestobacter sp. I12A-02628]|uniref:Cytochrome P450 n=1 Tax=Goekera deserti TaxID=2497753 RepID=A0A7K3WA16_9ACTN|nr:cytochrome P450 [Goekera deserti]MPQ98871.1 cytochrome P450 [Goekera deserti]NDI49630.1 cytochrome P450 [Goekera deserti]NEL53177.1 cytochrome P450 [Goekera deserti]
MSSTAVDRFDPMSPSFAAERFALMSELRAQAPAVFVPGIGMWAVTGYDAVREVLGDEERFPAGGGYNALRHLSAEARAVYPVDGPLFAYAVISTDDPLHARLRAPMTAAFSPRRVQALDAVVRADAEQIAGQVAARVQEQGQAVDLYEQVCRRLPPRTICRVFGLPVEEAPRFSAWSASFIALQVPGLPIEAQVQAMTDIAEFDAYVRDIVTGDLSGLDDGVLRTLVEGRRDGTCDLTEDELVGNLANVLFAGHETTVGTMSNMLVRLLRDRDHWAALAAGADPAPLLEELLRIDTSVMGLFRSTAAATRVDGVEVPAGAPLWVAFGAANRDPRAFDRPDEVLLDRPRTPVPLTWGHGAHYCIGTALARQQLRAVMTALPRACPALHLVGDVVEVPNHIARVSVAIPAGRQQP